LSDFFPFLWKTESNDGPSPFFPFFPQLMRSEGSGRVPCPLSLFFFPPPGYLREMADRRGNLVPFFFFLRTAWRGIFFSLFFSCRALEQEEKIAGERPPFFFPSPLPNDRAGRRLRAFCLFSSPFFSFQGGEKRAFSPVRL